MRRITATVPLTTPVSSTALHHLRCAQTKAKRASPRNLIPAADAPRAPHTMRIPALAAALAAPLVAAQVPNRPPTWIMNQSTM